MLRTLPKTSHQLTICEGNFLRLKKILQNFSKQKFIFQTINSDNSYNSISFNIIHKTKHTLIFEAKQNNKSDELNSFAMRIQICLDANLAEVISYQGEKAIPFFIKTSLTQSKDEKVQQNRFLTEWLESIFISGINPEINFDD
ncbi:MAG: hypothetical protein CMD46_06220 [Gammaproteobacteria bacterium]|nr:hypothetical protein [Gammaproteobacteria bacterium]|tara:strand:- start:7039 stop:7467 length:429 start_codon:yes stop_codon:yes gene_type:complete